MRNALLLGTLLLSTAYAGPASGAPAPATCQGVTATITGTGEVVGTNGPDVIVAGTADTLVRARGGDDLVCGSYRVDGGRGDDEIHVDVELGRFGEVFVRAGAGDDRVELHDDIESPAAGTDVGTYGGTGDDVLVGSDSISWLLGGPGNDRLVARRGGEIMDGGPGDDVLVGGRGQEIMYAGAGDDVMRARAAQDELQGGPGYDEAWGGPGTDICPPGNEVERSCEADDWVRTAARR